MNLTELKDVARRIGDKITEKRGYQVEVKKVEKINTSKTALIVDTGDTMRPTIYMPDELEHMYADEISEEMIEEAADWMLRSIDSAIVKKQSDTDIAEIEKIIHSKELLLSKVVFVLINKDWNVHNENWVSTPVDGDLEYIYYIPVEISGVRGGVKVLNEHVVKLGITNDEIYEAARKNTELTRPAKIMDMCDVLAERLAVKGIPFNAQNLCPSGLMYIVSNTDDYQGATAITYPSAIEGLTNMLGDNFVIIPASIHECIVLPIPNGMEDPVMLNELVQEVNVTSVDPTERLSDHIYKIVDGQLKSIA